MLVRSHKIRIFPTKSQKTLLLKSCGVSRFAYNWGLAEWKKCYESRERVNEGLLRKRLNAIKRKEFPWMLEVTKCAPEQALKDLGKAFKGFFNKQTKFPKFKKKGIKTSYYVSNDKFRLKNKILYLPKIGYIRTSENIRFSGKVLKAVVSLDVDRWYISVAVEILEAPIKTNGGIVGVDLGIKTLATLSDGTVFTNPRFYIKALKKIKRLSRSLSRKTKGSNNFIKSKKLLAKTHRKVRLARKTNLHQISTYLCNYYTTIVLEDLNVSGMLKNHNLSKAIHDCGWALFRRLVEDKSKPKGVRVIFADTFFPSSKMCSSCNTVKDVLKLNTRVYECNCGLKIDRDLNAAINLKKLGTCCSDVKPMEML